MIYVLIVLTLGFLVGVGFLIDRLVEVERKTRQILDLVSRLESRREVQAKSPARSDREAMLAKQNNR
jgi:hypothetical protein